MKSLLLSSALAQLFLLSAAQFDPPPTSADPSTIKDCSWWIVAEASNTCEGIASSYSIDQAQLVSYNPILATSCTFVTGASYCVEQNFGVPVSQPPVTSAPAPVPTTLVTSLKPSSAPVATSTGPQNGVVTPQPTQPGMITNCAKFHWIAKGVTCGQVIDFQKITLEEFAKWNPTVKSDCSGMWAEVNVCVGIIGGSITTAKPTTITPAVTPTNSAGNGVSTPQPTQPGMVTNCAKFHWVAKGVNCGQIISFQKITIAEFAQWNPTVRNDCSGMWAEVNVCVGIIGGPITTAKPMTTTPVVTPTTSAGNGVSTPQPTQPGMVTNCAKFHWVAKSVNCGQIISYQKITIAEFAQWNPTVGNDCSGMWAEVNVCVGVIGGGESTSATTNKPTPTTSAGNGVQTPQPTQPGMVTNCKKFHYVAEGVQCSQITSYQKISLEDFVKWNAGVGSNCQTMWAKTNVCVGV